MLFADIAGAIADFSIGLKKLAGDRTLKFLTNGFTGSLVWNLTGDRVVRLPDQSGTLLLSGQGTYNPIVPVSASKILALTDASTFQVCTNSSNITITVPSDGAVNFPVGAELEITQDGAGTVTISAALLVAVRRIGSILTTGHTAKARYGRIILRKVAANEWRLYGDL